MIRYDKTLFSDAGEFKVGGVTLQLIPEMGLRVLVTTESILNV